MSLTQVVKIKEVKDFLDENFIYPKVKIKAELLAPPLTKNYALIGTAFDYLVRFYVQRINKNTCIEGRWACEISIEKLERMGSNVFLLNDDYSPIDHLPLLNKAKQIVEKAKKLKEIYLKTGVFTDELLKISLLLAKLDSIYRAGIHVLRSLVKDFEYVDYNDILDLRNLVSLLRPEFFTKKDICILNPEFGRASDLVGGADADLIIDSTLIDIKTVKNAQLKREYFRQLLGYYMLSNMDRINGKIDLETNKLGIYFSRHAYLLTIDVEKIMKDKPIKKIVEEFRELVKSVYLYKIKN